MKRYYRNMIARFRNSQAGFTLVELLVVVGINSGPGCCGRPQRHHAR